MSSALDRLKAAKAEIEETKQPSRALSRLAAAKAEVQKRKDDASGMTALKEEAALKRARDLTERMQTPEKIQQQKEAAQKRARDMQTQFADTDRHRLRETSAAAAEERRQKTEYSNLLDLLSVAGRSADTTLGNTGQIALDVHSSPAQFAYDREVARQQAVANQRRTQEAAAQAKEWAKENRAAASAASVATNVLSGAEALRDLTAYGAVGEFMPDDGGFSATDITSALREGASSHRSDLGKFLYNTRMSAIDSLVSNEALLGLTAASNTMKDVKARGGSDRQAAISGVFSGLAESFFEHLSLGKLRALKDVPVEGVKTVLRNLGSQALVNASEETLTELANILFDTNFMGELSNYALLAEQYMAEGMTEKEAKRKAAWEMAKQIGVAGASGALMGLFFGLGGSAEGALNSRAMNISAQTGSEARQSGGREAVQTAVERAAEQSQNRDATEKAVLKATDETLQPGDMQTRQQGETQQEQQAAKRAGENASASGLNAEALEKYPNLKKLLLGETVEPGAAAEEALSAVMNGEISKDQGRELTRRAISEAKAEAQPVQQTEATTPAAEERTPGYYGNAEDADAQYLDRLAKAAGVTIEKIPAAQAGNREGWIIGGKVYLSEGAEDVQRIVAKHEVTHQLQVMAENAYNNFRGYVENIYRQRGTLEQQLDGLKNLYRENDQELTDEEALDELAANYAGELLENESLIRRLAGEDRSLGQQILDAIRDILRRMRAAFGDQETRQLERAARLWEKALKETNEAYYQQGKRSDSRQARNMYAGEQSATADLDALARAKEMDNQDVSAETIRQQTGWFKGMDGKWRYEIDDSAMRYERRGDLNFRKRHEGYDRYRELTRKAEDFMLGQSDEWLTMEEQQELTELQGTWGNTFRTDGRVAPDALPTTKLTDYIDHPELFEAYPELRDASLVFAELPEGTRGQYDRENNIIRVSRDLRHAPQETLLHEIQHAVQQIEGFTGGASVEYWENQQRAGKNKTKNEGAIKAANQRYRELFDAAPEELRQTVRKINQAKMAGDWDAVLALEDEIYDGPYADIYSELGDADFDRRTLIEQNEPISAKELYRNTAGEIEARDTGKRRNFTAEERKKTAPDLGGENTVFADEGGRYLSAAEAEADEEILHLKDQIRANLAELNEMQPVADVKTPAKFPSRLSDRRAWVESTLKTTEVDRRDLGKVNLGTNQIRKGLTYAKDPADVAAFAAVPAVIKRGRRIMGHEKHKGNEVKSVTLAAPVVINGKPGVMGVVVQHTSGNNYKAHKILMPDGTAFVLEENREAEPGPVMAQSETDRLDKRTSSASGNSVARERDSVKGARELQQQIDRLTKQNKRLQAQMKISNMPRASRKAVEQQATELRKAYGSTVDKAELTGRLEKLYDAMYAQSGGKTKKTMSWSEIREEARSIADAILAEATGNVNPKTEEYAQLRKELRDRKISIAERDRADLASMGGYNELRKQNMGSLTLSKEGTPVDVVYQELSDQYPELFPDDIYHPADQLMRISDVVQELKAVEGNPYAQDMENTAAYLAGEIEERFYDTPTEVEAIESQLSRQFEKQRRKERDANSRRLLQQQTAHEQVIRDMEERFREENRKRIANQSASERRETIRRHADRLGRKLVRPTDKQHVPAEMRGAALALVRYIDTESGYEMAFGPDAKYHRVKPGTELGAEITSRTAAARELQAEYKKLGEDTTLTIDPDMQDYLDEIAKMGNKRVADMTRAELDTVWRVMQVIEHTIGQANDLLEESRYRDLKQMADALKRDNGGKADRVDRAGRLGEADKLLNLDMLTPETYFSRMGEAGKDIFRQMRKAADRQTVILKEGTDRARKLIEESGVNFAEADKELHAFDLDGGKITLSTSQLMELYALSKRKAALEHIYIGGLKPVEATEKGKVIGGSKPVKVTPEDVAEMIDTLTEKQRALVDGMQKYLSGDLARHGNEESRKVYGYDKFLEKNYWPIKVSSTEVASDPGKAATAKTIPGYGMTKALQPHAKNAVELRSAIDTYSRHLNQMATYAAWLGTNENITRLQNFKYETEDGHPDGNVKQLIEKVYGKNGNDYLQNLLSDIAQGTKAGADRSALERGLGQFKAAKVGGNLRVIIQQPTSILRAMEMVDPKYFASGKTTSGKGWEKAVKYAPIAQWKDWGYFEMDTGMSLRELMTGAENKLDKAKNALMAPAGAADSVAWGYLWNAVEAETADTHPELQKGTEAFYRAVADRFSEVVDHTQVVDSVLHRSQIMRSSNYLNKVSTSFMSEPMKVYNMVVRDLYDLRGAEGEEAKKKAQKQLARTSASLIVSFAVNALAQSIVDGLRDDDREKKYLDKVADQWAGNFAENFNPIGYIPVAKDVLSLVQGYTLERSEMEGVAELITSMRQFSKATQGESQKTVLAAGLEAASKLGDLLGLPVSNLKRDAEAIVRTAMIAAGASRALYAWDKMVYSPEKAMSKFYDDMYRAMDTDQNTYELIYDDVLNMLQEQGMEPDEAAAKIKTNVENRMKKELGLEKTSSLPVRYSAPGESDVFDELMREAEAEGGSWAEAFGEETVEMARELDAMEDANKTQRVAQIGEMPFADDVREDALESILSDKEWARYQAAKAGGVKLIDWCDFYESVKDERTLRTGKSGTESQEDVEAVLKRMSLTDKQRTAIWNSYGWKAESPWS